MNRMTDPGAAGEAVEALTLICVGKGCWFLGEWPIFRITRPARTPTVPVSVIIYVYIVLFPRNWFVFYKGK